MSKKKQKSKNKVYIGLVLGLIILIALVSALYIRFKQDNKIAAIVNGEKITYAQVEDIYMQLPESYRFVMSKNEVLDQVINEKLLLQEASKRGITSTDQEVEDIIDTIVTRSGMSEDEFESTLEQEGISRENLKEYYQTQLIVLKLLNETAFKDISVSEQEINEYYEAELEGTISLEDSKEQIEQLLLAEKKQQAFEEYAEELREKSDIEIFFGIETFDNQEEKICLEDGKPIIRMFTTSKCSECPELERALEAVTAEKEVVTYIWELDTGDNKITSIEETKIPKSEVDIFKQVSPKLKVPAFVFGCRYHRLGAGYDNILDEQNEFGLVIDELLDEDE